MLAQSAHNSMYAQKTACVHNNKYRICCLLLLSLVSQTLQFFDMFRAKYAPLGARSINFVTYYAADGLSAGHAIVIGLPSDVLVVFRGTSDLSQVFATGRYDKQAWTIMNTTMYMYYAPWASMQGLWPKLLPVVRAAVAATDDPAAAKLYTTGGCRERAGACMCVCVLCMRRLC